MKIDRLLQMVLLFIHKKKLTASYLAEHFGVTVKTIRRDIDTLSIAGIPIYAEIGRNGGYYIHEDFALDKSLFSKKEKHLLDSILSGLELELLNEESKSIYHKLISKEPKSRLEHGSMVFDLNAWQRSKSDSQNLKVLDTVITCRQKIRCTYYKPNTEAFSIEIMPIKLVLKTGMWYVHALYKNKKEFRYYKLNRMQEIEILDDYFEVDKALLESVDYYEEWYGFDEKYEVKVRFYKPIYGELDKVMDTADIPWEAPFFDYTLHSSVDTWLLSTLLSFREHVSVYDVEAREQIKTILSKLQTYY